MANSRFKHPMHVVKSLAAAALLIACIATPALAQQAVTTTTRCGLFEDACRADSGAVCILSGQPRLTYRCETTRIVTPQSMPEVAKTRR